jgi:hypothetical protein
MCILYLFRNILFYSSYPRWTLSKQVMFMVLAHGGVTCLLHM